MKRFHAAGREGVQELTERRARGEREGTTGDDAVGWRHAAADLDFEDAWDWSALSGLLDDTAISRVDTRRNVLAASVANLGLPVVVTATTIATAADNHRFALDVDSWGLVDAANRAENFIGRGVGVNGTTARVLSLHGVDARGCHVHTELNLPYCHAFAFDEDTPNPVILGEPFVSGRLGGGGDWCRP